MKGNLRLKKPHKAACNEADASGILQNGLDFDIHLEKSIWIKYHSRGPEASLGHGFFIFDCNLGW